MKKALVLSGGGSKGSMQFGILKHIFEQGYKPDVIYGTSVGSLNAAGISHVGIEGLQDIWNSLKKTSDVFKINLGFFLFLSSGLYNAKPLKKLLEKTIKNNPPMMDAYSCKVHLETGEIVYSYCLDKDYIESTVASCSIPGFTEDINGWVDGGVREQTPLHKAIQNGADEIVVVLCNPLKSNPDFAKKGNWIKNILRATELLAHETFLTDIQACIWHNENLEEGRRSIKLTIYAPRELVIGSNDFESDKIQKAIKYGYEQAIIGPIDLEYIKKL
jgi:NTE family protein